MATKKILGILFVPSEGKTKQLTANRELWLFFKPT
jgi:hypothetical protein